MVHFGEFLKTWSLRSNSVSRQVSFNRTKIGGKCQNPKIQMRHFGWFSNTVPDLDIPNEGNRRKSSINGHDIHDGYFRLSSNIWHNAFPEPTRKTEKSFNLLPNFEIDLISGCPNKFCAFWQKTEKLKNSEKNLLNMSHLKVCLHSS